MEQCPSNDDTRKRKQTGHAGRRKKVGNMKKSYLTTARAWAAKASLSSKRSTSPIPHPALVSALCTAGTGPTEQTYLYMT